VAQRLRLIDGVNHDHRIYISNTNGTSAMYGDGNSETTAPPISGSMKDSGDDQCIQQSVLLCHRSSICGGGTGMVMAAVAAVVVAVAVEAVVVAATPA